MTKLTQQEIADRPELSRATPRAFSQAEERESSRFSSSIPGHQQSENQVKDESGLKESPHRRTIPGTGRSQRAGPAEPGGRGMPDEAPAAQTTRWAYLGPHYTREVAKQMPPFYVEGVRQSQRVAPLRKNA